MSGSTNQAPGPEGPPAQPGPHWLLARGLERAPDHPGAGPAAALLHKRRIATALKPLLPQAPGSGPPLSGFSGPPDDSTAWVAEQHGPTATGHWDLAIFVDPWLSMEFWRPVTAEFLHLLRRLGLCRQEAAHTFDRESVSEWTRPPRSGGRQPNTGPAVVLTDGLADAWYTAGAGGLLHALGQVCPVVVVHLLPEELWPSTGIVPRPRAVYGQVRGPRWPAGSGEAAPDAFPVPVLALREAALSRWAKFLARGPGSWSHLPTLLVPAPAAPLAPPPLPAWHDSAGTVGELIADFGRTASEGARTLATALAAVPLNLPVMRHVQSRAVPGSAPDLLSELFIGGLLVPVVRPAEVRDHDRITFDFPAGARQLLLTSVKRASTAEVLADAASFVEHTLGVPGVARWGGLHEAADGTEEQPVTAGSEPFLRVQLDVLKTLSGPYAARARALEAALDAWSGRRPGDGQGPPVADFAGP
ncbi:hypothetical protein ACF073_11285 [Streptomyces sp. NPDC015171]|uniref:hypothetical protein n=1 Tax=Streptomyces sp. NPDC015171 TaxID=3364945 RepID=UPI0036FC16FE